ncbi:hypothetical protein [Moorena sp. SIO3I8]|uniref:hypothetical protein n=1 Tax=Moorena sp. SIO3I8 TaxID=2607833 RepID=UPI0013BFC801|nr:hypothetical protein [Moorena sp. SIO3I8]NEO10068.1 hypothetical protein [Moorena sp. SIO3I8]
MKLQKIITTLSLASVITTLAVVDIPKNVETFAYSSTGHSRSENIDQGSDFVASRHGGRSARFEDGVFSVRLPGTATAGQQLDSFISANSSFRVDSRKKYVRNITIGSISRDSISRDGSVSMRAKWSAQVCVIPGFNWKGKWKCYNWSSEGDSFGASCSIGGRTRYLRCRMPEVVNKYVREGSISIN